jgi:hypothetical protein
MTTALFMESLIPVFIAPRDTIAGQKLYCDSLSLAIDAYIKTLLDPSNYPLLTTASVAFSTTLFAFLSGKAMASTPPIDAKYAAMAHATAFQTYMFTWQATFGVTTSVLFLPGRTLPGSIITNTIFRPPVLSMEEILFNSYQIPSSGDIAIDVKKAAFYFMTAVVSVISSVIFTINCLDSTPPPIIDIGPIPYIITGGFKIT